MPVLADDDVVVELYAERLGDVGDRHGLNVMPSGIEVCGSNPRLLCCCRTRVADYLRPTRKLRLNGGCKFRRRTTNDFHTEEL